MAENLKKVESPIKEEIISIKEEVLENSSVEDKTKSKNTEMKGSMN